MKATRILLFLSPLLWFMPPLVDVGANTGLGLLDYFYRGLLGGFPGNALMAFLCYTYAGQLGRESWPWVVGSLRFPFIAPLILVFMPAKYGSAGDEQRRGQGEFQRGNPGLIAEIPRERSNQLFQGHALNSTGSFHCGTWTSKRSGLSRWTGTKSLNSEMVSVSSTDNRP